MNAKKVSRIARATATAVLFATTVGSVAQTPNDVDEARKVARKETAKSGELIRAARVLEGARAGHEALPVLERVVREAPESPAAAEALFLSARCHTTLNEAALAAKSVKELEASHPDSSYLVRAKWVLCGATTASKEHRLWISEQAAAEQYDSALRLDKEGQTTGAAEVLSRLIADHPRSAARWRAQESLGHIRLKTNQPDDAFNEFAEIVSAVGPVAPKSRIVSTSLRRMAALKQRKKEHQAAYNFYMAASEASANPESASDNLLQAAGAFFEVAQHQDFGGTKQTTETWRTVKDVLRVARDAAITSETESIADLMLVELECWMHNDKGAATSATQLRAVYGPEQFHRVHWTLAYFEACGLLDSGRPADAAKLFGEFMVAVDNKPLWPNVDHHVRAAYNRIHCLKAAKASSDELAEAKAFLLANYPDSIWAKRVRENW